jgi:hypothetical protein
MMLFPVTLLTLYFSGIRQDAKITELYRSGEAHKVDLAALNSRILAPKPAVMYEKMTANRTDQYRYPSATTLQQPTLRRAPQQHQPHPPHKPHQREREAATSQRQQMALGPQHASAVAQPQHASAVSRDVRTVVDRREQHAHTHPGVRNASGHAPSRVGEETLIHSTSHLEDNAGFYAHSSNDRSQQRTNVQNGYSFNRIQSDDAPGQMQLRDALDANGQHGRAVRMDYSGHPDARDPPRAGSQAGDVREQDPHFNPHPPQNKLNPLASLFEATAVSDDKSDNDVEQMKEGRMS